MLKYRFIPACAGNTDYALMSDGSGAVHPRLCGEHYSLVASDEYQDGSSPPVRGTP